MTKRKMLHEIVDRLPEEEVPLALRILTLEEAPVDDEPFDPSQIEGLDDHPILSHDDVKRRLVR